MLFEVENIYAIKKILQFYECEYCTKYYRRSGS